MKETFLAKMIQLNPNCSEATMRISMKNLAENEKKELTGLIEAIEQLSESEGKDEDISMDIIRTKFDLTDEEAKEKWWDTFWGVKDIFGTECLEIKGETPFNESEWLHEKLGKLDFYKKLEIEEGE